MVYTINKKFSPLFFITLMLAACGQGPELSYGPDASEGETLTETATDTATDTTTETATETDIDTASQTQTASDTETETPTATQTQTLSGCDEISEDDLSHILVLNTTSSSVYAGESVTISWDVDENYLVEKNVSDYAAALSVDDYSSGEYAGNLELTVAESVTVKLSISACSLSAERSLKITAKNFELLEDAEATLLANARKKSAFYTANKATLAYSEDNGSSYSVMSSSRNGMFYNNETIADTADITALFEMSKGCSGYLFYGTAGGYVYRSKNGGKSAENLDGLDYALAYLTTDFSDPLDHPSRINFISPHPTDENSIFIGHDDGLLLIKNCDTDDVADLVNIDSTNSDHDFAHTNTRYAAVYEKKLYIATDEGVYYSGDGFTWSEINGVTGISLIQASGDRLYIGTSTGIRTFDGDSWNEFELSSVTGIIDWGTVLIAGNADGLWVSLDDGKSWTEIMGTNGSGQLIDTQSSKLMRYVFSVGDDGSIYRLATSKLSVLQAMPVLSGATLSITTWR